MHSLPCGHRCSWSVPWLLQFCTHVFMVGAWSWCNKPQRFATPSPPLFSTLNASFILLCIFLLYIYFLGALIMCKWTHGYKFVPLLFLSPLPFVLPFMWSIFHIYRLFPLPFALPHSIKKGLTFVR